MKIEKLMNEYDVIIIGGGATGAGTLRDCSLRGLKAALIERSDIATGATGRNHGLLHSGARYAVTDQESAQECISENQILRHIARHCVDETDGFFISLPDDDLAFQNKFVASCQMAGIRADVLDPKEALSLEPSMNPSAIGAVRVPDGSIDPFRLTASNIQDAKAHGATVLTYHLVTELLHRQGTITGVRATDMRTGEQTELHAPIVVNACGIWGAHLAQMAGVKISMFPAKGALLIYGHRVNKIVLNRCRKPSDADILVPGDTICLIGTTSTKVPYDEIDNMYVLPEEVEILRKGAQELSPILEKTRILRCYAGVRPLVASDDDPSGRSVSRGIVLFDHEKRDGLKGFITITGGKLMTYRLMAEKATDLVCEKLDVNKKCETAHIKLPGSREEKETTLKKLYSMPISIQESMVYRHGDMAEKMSKNNTINNSLVCECEEVSYGEVSYAIDHMDVHNLIDLRRRTRVGMGTCQGEFCACRAIGILAKQKQICPTREKEELIAFLNERWKGVKPIAWGDSLRESQYASWVYESVCGLGDENKK
ncbi:MAG: anaerobic glycerol-3-phosphate dehydrogenase subunit A [Bacteroidales bacterium]|nr:anaerobic glycerol-3-phosphate dehydrogenase subunit A [Bacteroidales bacterium]